MHIPVIPSSTRVIFCVIEILLCALLVSQAKAQDPATAIALEQQLKFGAA
jgi:hypothetical protein